MTIDALPPFLGRSGLSEDELSSLWARLREQWPAAFSILSGPVVNMDREEATRWDAPIHNVIQERYGDLRSHTDRIRIYEDMKHLQGWQRLAAIIERTRILDAHDYWTVRNSALAFPNRLSKSHDEILKQVLAAYEHENLR